MKGLMYERCTCRMDMGDFVGLMGLAIIDLGWGRKGVFFLKVGDMMWSLF